MIEEFSLAEEPQSRDLSHCTAATRNACKLCTPLGACLVFRGIQGAIPFLHGSQGCSTYIRRYLISHFREPMDIAASNFNEDSAVFGGAKNLHAGLKNVSRQYKPAMIGVATTCLSETIGEDMAALLLDCRRAIPDLPPVVHVSTASYRGSHIDGFHDAVTALIDQLVLPPDPHGGVNLLPGMLSTADLRHLRELVEAFGLPVTMLPDYSDTLDGPTWMDYEALPEGGTSVEAIRRMSGARATLEFGDTLRFTRRTAATNLAERFGVVRENLGTPIGLRATEAMIQALERISGRPCPTAITAERGRLLDSMVDAHKVVFGKRAVVYGEADLVIGLTSFLCEIGVEPVLCASGGKSEHFPTALRVAVPELPSTCVVRDNMDFVDIDAVGKELKPDILIGNSKGYGMARALDIPLVRAGFPIHDRLGGQRVLHVGYRGAQQFYDQIVNTFLARKQEKSTVGYSYL